MINLYATPIQLINKFRNVEKNLQIFLNYPSFEMLDSKLYHDYDLVMTFVPRTYILDGVVVYPISLYCDYIKRYL